VYETLILKWIFENWTLVCAFDSAITGQTPLAGCYEYGGETLCP
jgi:hypothetical protein